MWANWQKNFSCYNPKIVTKLSAIWVGDPESEIQRSKSTHPGFLITDPGLIKHRIQDSGSGYVTLQSVGKSRARPCYVYVISAQKNCENSKWNSGFPHQEIRSLWWVKFNDDLTLIFLLHKLESMEDSLCSRYFSEFSAFCLNVTSELFGLLHLFQKLLLLQ